ncbi:MAG: porin [Myxococcota bacterium]|nr:porin [Myxococcota bacterium]
MHPSTRLFRVRATSLFSAVVIALALSPAAGADGGGWQKDWKNGIGWKSSDGDFSARVGGRLFADFATVSEDSALKAGDWDGNGSGVELRQARIKISGTAYGRLAWKGQYDFAGDKVKDVWVSLKDIPLAGTLKIGHFKEPFSLEEMESLRFTTFMERSVAIAFSPSRNTGIQFNNTAFDKRMTWAVGGFRQSGDKFGDTDSFSDSSAYQITGRVTGAPIYQADGERVIHLGVSYSHKFRSLGGEAIRWKTRPESHLANTVADTGNLSTDGADLLNLELAVVGGPLSFQAEYTNAWADFGAAGTVRSWGMYAQGSFFLTGEHRNYKLKKGVFGRIKILKPLGEGWGAWEIAARFSRLQLLNASSNNAGNIRDITLGLNWYLFSNFRVMANYVYSDIDNAVEKYQGDANIFQMRVQVDF